MQSTSVATLCVGGASLSSSELTSVDQTQLSIVTSPVCCTKSPTRVTTTPAIVLHPTPPSGRSFGSRQRRKSHLLLRGEESVPSSVPRKRKRPVSISPQSGPALRQVEEFFEVERILSERRVDGKTEVLIKWLNYDEQSWEPLSSLKECPHLLKEFRRHRRSGAPLSPPPQQPLQSLQDPLQSVLDPGVLTVQKQSLQSPPATLVPCPLGPTAPSHPPPRSGTMNCSRTVSSPRLVPTVETARVNSRPNSYGDPVASFLALDSLCDSFFPVRSFTMLPVLSDFLPDLFVLSLRGRSLLLLSLSGSPRWSLCGRMNSIGFRCV